MNYPIAIRVFGGNAGAIRQYGLDIDTCDGVTHRLTLRWYRRWGRRAAWWHKWLRLPELWRARFRR